MTLPVPGAIEPWVGDITAMAGHFYEADVAALARPEFSPEEIALVCDTLFRDQTDFICEWGTNVGHSARLFHDAVGHLDLDCDIHSVEIATEVAGGRGHIVRDLDVHLYVGDGLTIGLRLLAEAEPKSPLFFLDDSHVYADVLEQLEAIAFEVPYATMIVHDVFTVDVLGNEMLHEPGLAVRDFTGREDYVVESVNTGGRMMRLTPK